MPTIIEIRGFGEVEFPDSMSMEDIETAIEQDILPSAASGAPSPALTEAPPAPEPPSMLERAGEAWEAGQEFGERLQAALPTPVGATIEGIKAATTLPARVLGAVAPDPTARAPERPATLGESIAAGAREGALEMLRGAGGTAEAIGMGIEETAAGMVPGMAGGFRTRPPPPPPRTELPSPPADLPVETQDRLREAQALLTERQNVLAEAVQDPRAPVHMVQEKARLVGSALRDTGEEMARLTGELQEASREEFPEDPTTWTGRGAGLVRGATRTIIGNVAPAYLTGIVAGPQAALAAIAAPVFGSKFHETYAKTGDAKLATAEGLFYALTEAATERLPMTYYLGLDDAAKRGVLRRMFGGALREGPTEMVNEALQIGWETGVADAEMTVDEAIRRVVDAGLLGGMVGGMMGAVSALEAGAPGARVEAAPPQPPEETATFEAEERARIEAEMAARRETRAAQAEEARQAEIDEALAELEEAAGPREAPPEVPPTMTTAPGAAPPTPGIQIPAVPGRPDMPSIEAETALGAAPGRALMQPPPDPTTIALPYEPPAEPAALEPVSEPLAPVPAAPMPEPQVAPPAAPEPVLAPEPPISPVAEAAPRPVRPMVQLGKGRREPFTDARILREGYRSGLQAMADELETERQDRVGYWEDTSIGLEQWRRYGSMNPPWFLNQGWTASEVRRAVEVALAGGRLGTRQDDIIRHMLGHMAAYVNRGMPEGDMTVDEALARRRFANAERRALRAGFPPLAAYDPDAEVAGEIYEEEEYDPDWDTERRLLSEIAREAQAIDPERAMDIMAAHQSDERVAQELLALIAEEAARGQEVPTDQAVAPGPPRAAAAPSVPTEPEPRAPAAAPAEAPAPIGQPGQPGRAGAPTEAAGDVTARVTAAVESLRSAIADIQESNELADEVLARSRDVIRAAEAERAPEPTPEPEAPRGEGLFGDETPELARRQAVEDRKRELAAERAEGGTSAGPGDLFGAAAAGAQMDIEDVAGAKQQRAVETQAEREAREKPRKKPAAPKEKARELEKPEPASAAPIEAEPVTPERPPRLSRARPGMTTEQVENAIAPVRLRWRDPGFPSVVVLADEAALAERLPDMDLTDVEGVTVDDFIYLVASNLSDPTRVQQVLAHEAVGHFALEDMLGRQEFDRLRRQVLQLERSGNRRVRELSRRVRERIDAGAMDEATRAGEILALLAEERVTEPRLQALLRSLRAAIRRFLRRIGIDLTFSDADIDILISRAGRYLRTAEIGPRAPDYTLPKFARVFHGSPHEFREFDVSRIGTGEGAQAYGHGLYFAQKPGTAKSYQVQLSGGPAEYKFGGGEQVNRTKARDLIVAQAIKLHELDQGWPGNNPYHWADDVLAMKDTGMILPEIERLAKEMIDEGANGGAELLAAARAARELGDIDVIRNTGHFYEVDLPDEAIDRMLDWDAPLSEQPESVREAINAILNSPMSGTETNTIGGYRAWNEALGNYRVDEARTAGDLYRALTGVFLGQEKATDVLREAGIPGIKYWDAGSREAAEGTRNFVVFDDSLLKILRRNEQPLFSRRPRYEGGIDAPELLGETRPEPPPEPPPAAPGAPPPPSPPPPPPGGNVVQGAMSSPPPPPPTDYTEGLAAFREEHKGLWHKASTALRRQFHPEGLLPTEVHKEKITRDSQFNAVEFDVRHRVGVLEQAVKQAYGKRYGKLEEAKQAQISRALHGEMDATLPEPVAAAVLSMRRYIDGLSRRYAATLGDEAWALQQVAEELRTEQQGLSAERQEMEPDDPRRARTLKRIRSLVSRANMTEADAQAKARLMATILGNLGEYVHRSYKAFDDPKWFKKVTPEIYADARQYLMDRYREDGMSVQEAGESAFRVMEDIVKHGTAYDDLSAFIRETPLGAKDLSVLMRRKDIAAPIRALLGEHTDPRVNFANSATKMGRLIWNQAFLDRVLEAGEGTFLFEDGTQPPGATAQISAEGNPALAPIDGMRTYPEVLQGFHDAVGTEQMADWYRTVVQLNGLIKYGKTVLAPTTVARNWMSAAMFTIANGHFNWVHAGRSVQGLREYFVQRGRGAQLAYLRRLQELGVIYDTPYAGEMVALLADSRLDEHLMYGAKRLTLKRFMDLVTRAYQYGDDFWKIIGFENEKRALMRTGMTEADAEIEAAERVRNTYPTYSLVPRAIKSLRRFPLAGTFVSFPAEIIRTSTHLARYTAADLRNPTRRAMGARRIAGLAVASGLTYAAQEFSKALLSVDDDEEEAVRRLAAPWQANSQIFFAARLDDGNLRYLDMSHHDPYNLLKRPFVALARNQPWTDKMKQALWESFEPFLGQDIGFGAIVEIFENKKESGGPVYNEFDMPDKQLADMLDHLRMRLQPGLFSNMERTYKAMKGERTRSGKRYELADEAAAWVGFRVTTLDPKTALYYRSFEFQDAKRAASKMINQILNDPNPVTPDALSDAYKRALRTRQKAFEDLFLIVSAARKAGLRDSTIRRILFNSNIGKRDAVMIMRGEMRRWTPSHTSFRALMRKSRALFDDETRREFRRRFQDLRRMARQQPPRTALGTTQ